MSDEQILRIEPRTPEELAAFKAAKSRAHQRRQTTKNLIWATLASLGVLLVLVFLVIRPAKVERDPVDYPAVAEDAAAGFDWQIAIPKLPTGWWVNAAEVRVGEDDRQPYWYVGLLTETDDFMAIEQRSDADPTWVTRTLGGAQPTGDEVIDGVSWLVYDHRDNTKYTPNRRYALATEIPMQDGGPATTVILYGTAGSDQFRHLAGLILESLED